MIARLQREIMMARQRISNFVRQTYLIESPFYNELISGRVFFKCENLQRTGSFKVRGAFNKVLSLPESIRKRGVVAASTGNHGKAVALVTSSIKSPCHIFCPEDADPTKVSAIRRAGATVTQTGTDCVQTESAARSFAEENSFAYVSPYNDPFVIAGQGTIGLEIIEQLRHFGLNKIDHVFASVGGGGLVSGIGAAIASRSPNTKIVGCSPANSNVMFQSLEVGSVLDAPSAATLSEGTAGGVEADSITFELCKSLLDYRLSVTEDEIVDSLCEFIDQHSMLIEGAAAVAIAGLKRLQNELRGKSVVVVLCGANIGSKTLLNQPAPENQPSPEQR